MENKKSLRVNCAICDTCGITEELLAAYEKIQIKCANMITTPAVQILMGKYNVKWKAASVVSVPGDKKVNISIVNGSMEITPRQALPEENTVLIVNGSLKIAPGTEKILERYAHITVNGSAQCPEGMPALLRHLLVNGKTKTYPEGSILLKATAVLDRTFHLRAKQNGLYFAGKQIVALDAGIRFDALAAKNVRFKTPELLVCESNAEAAVALVDEQADIVVVPDGCAYVDGNATLNDVLLKRYGGKLYIDGHLTVNPDSVPWLEQVEYLRVDGDIRATRSVRDRAAALDAVYDRLVVIAESRIRDKDRLTVTRALLEEVEDSLDICDCASVEFQEDVPPELIREKLLHLCDCASVICTPEQLPVLELMAKDVGYLGTEEEAQEKEEGGDENESMIHSAIYTF